MCRIYWPVMAQPIACWPHEVAIVTNSHGNQVVDAWAVAAADPSEMSSMDHTRSVNGNIFIERGMGVFSNRRRPMMTLVSDSAALRHDTLLCPCNADLYRQLGFEGFHRSCSGNFHEALAEKGIVAAQTCGVSQPFHECGGERRWRSRPSPMRHPRRVTMWR